MPPFDGKAFAAEIVASVRQHVSEVVRPLAEKVAAVEQRVTSLPVAKDGMSVTVADVAPMIAVEVGKAVAAIPVPKDGMSVTLADVAPLIAEQLGKAVEALPKPQDGKDADPALVASLVFAEVAKIPAAAPGKDADPEVTARLVKEEVTRQVGELPAPKEGKSVSADDLAPLMERLVTDAVAKLPKAKDGVGVAGAVIDRGGSLVLTLTDGTTKDLGVIVGRDADMTELARLIKEEVGKLPAPKDGKDGFGFDDLTVTHDGERKFTLRFVRGDQVKEFSLTLDHVLDRGVWREGKFLKGDGVTFGGSFFIAQKDTEAKPETSQDWRLSIKRGRDGKDADPQAMVRAIDAAIAKLPPSKLKPVPDKV